MKVEGNRHALGLKIMDLKVHVQVLMIYSAHAQQHLIGRRKKTCTLWIQKSNTLWTYCHLHIHKNPTACHTVWKGVLLCRHMVSCTCYDFQHGHLCKHSHKVHQSLYTSVVYICEAPVNLCDHVYLNFFPCAFRWRW